MALHNNHNIRPTVRYREHVIITMNNRQAHLHVCSLWRVPLFSGLFSFSFARRFCFEGLSADLATPASPSSSFFLAATPALLFFTLGFSSTKSPALERKTFSSRTRSHPYGHPQRYLRRLQQGWAATQPPPAPARRNGTVRHWGAAELRAGWPAGWHSHPRHRTRRPALTLFAFLFAFLLAVPPHSRPPRPPFAGRLPHDGRFALPRHSGEQPAPSEGKRPGHKVSRESAGSGLKDGGRGWSGERVRASLRASGAAAAGPAAGAWGEGGRAGATSACLRSAVRAVCFCVDTGIWGSFSERLLAKWAVKELAGRSCVNNSGCFGFVFSNKQQIPSRSPSISSGSVWTSGSTWRWGMTESSEAGCTWVPMPGCCSVIAVCSSNAWFVQCSARGSEGAPLSLSSSKWFRVICSSGFGFCFLPVK